MVVYALAVVNLLTVLSSVCDDLLFRAGARLSAQSHVADVAEWVLNSVVHVVNT